MADSDPTAPTQWHSQSGEDEILSGLLTAADGVFVEVGAADGIEGSNTLVFERRGWRGVLVEANPHLANRCRSVRSSPVAEHAVTAPGAPQELPFQIVPDIPQLSGLDLHPETLRTYGIDRLETVHVSTRTLDEVLDEHLPDEKIDFITIDVEGHEWAVLQGFSIDTWQPKIVIIERNYQPSIRILRYMRLHGYAYVRTTGVNDWFERGIDQSVPQLVRAVAPLYLQGFRPLVKSGLARLGMLGSARRLRRSG